MRTTIFLILDFAVFFLLWLALGIHWGIAFFLSTALVYAGWWIYEWMMYELKKFPKS